MKRQLVTILVVLMLIIGISPGLAGANEAKATGGVKDWEGAFQKKTPEAFKDALAEGVVLEAAVLYAPIVGRDNVALSMATAANMYKYCNFTTRVTYASKQFLEWELETYNGLKMSGTTVITRNKQGKIQHLAISHRPRAESIQFGVLMALHAPAIAQYFIAPKDDFNDLLIKEVIRKK